MRLPRKRTDMPHHTKKNQLVTLDTAGPGPRYETRQACSDPKGSVWLRPVGRSARVYLPIFRLVPVGAAEQAAWDASLQAQRVASAPARYRTAAEPTPTPEQVVAEA